MSSIPPDQIEPMKADKRQTYRVGVAHSLQFAKRHKTTPTGTAFLCNLSDSGCSLRCTTQLQVGDRMALVLELPQPVLITDARVAWTNGTLYGLTFVRVSPLEHTRLRRFLWKQISCATVDNLEPIPACPDRKPFSHEGLRMVP